MPSFPCSLSSNILHMDKLQEGCPVMISQIPNQIQKEIDVWVNESKKFKNSPLAALKAHENVGYLANDGKKHNSYQCSISPHLVDSSFWLAWVLRLTEKYWGMGRDDHQFKIRKFLIQVPIKSNSFIS